MKYKRLEEESEGSKAQRKKAKTQREMESLSTQQRKKLLESDSDYRSWVFKKLLTHISGGYSLESFPWLGKDKIESLMEWAPEFDREALEEALRKNLHLWESIGKKQSTGELIGNSRSWYYNMCNRHGWRERAEIKQETTSNLKIEVVRYE